MKFYSRSELKRLIATSPSHVENEFIKLQDAVRKVLSAVSEQAEDEALWAVPESEPIVEAYLRQELRVLHKVIEDVFPKGPTHVHN